MKKNARTNNKGFSLVELIIIIAIMGILTVVLMPQLMKYVEKANVSNDLQVAGTVKKAVELALINPLIYDDLKSLDIIEQAGLLAGVDFDVFDTSVSLLEDEIYEILGVSSYEELKDELKSFTSKPDYIVRFFIHPSGTVEIILPFTDETGGKNPSPNTNVHIEGNNWITVGVPKQELPLMPPP